jgi:hypothetical protein
MQVTYTPCHKPHAEGYLTLQTSKYRGQTITLVGAAIMTQAELDAYGNQIAESFAEQSNMDKAREAIRALSVEEWEELHDEATDANFWM